MIGLYFSTISQTDEQINGAIGAFQSHTGLAESEYFIASPASHCSSPPVQSGDLISCLSPLAHESIQGAVFVPPLRSFRDKYSEAMIALVYNAVEEGGFVFLPYNSVKVAGSTGYWSVDWLRDILGKEHKILKDPNYMVFKRDDALIPPESVFSAVTNDLEGLATAFMHERGLVSDPDYMKSCSSFISGAADQESLGMKTAVAMLPDVQQGVEEFLKYVTYSVTGASYKTEALRRFIGQYLPNKRNLRVVDIGGGMGFVDIELLLTCPSVERLVNCEPVISTLPVTKRLVERFSSTIRDRFSLAIHPAQEYPFDQPIDVLSDFASLLYLPREDLVDTLDRAWTALRPGGIFVIHENIKRPIFKDKGYYNSVFEVKELDGYLKKYGSIDRYRSSDMAPISTAAAKDQTVFRVVQKSPQS
ncbi:MAG: hypothetical protein JKY43_11770 [Phycisphaerales bacterium]|nr:hypothetical protein [Phycisphaerales bacterium]